MGNSASDVNDAVKAQAAGGGPRPPMYKILDFGGGVLADHWQKALVSKNYEEVDNYIKNDLSTWMYNEGKGEQVKQLRNEAMSNINYISM